MIALDFAVSYSWWGRLVTRTAPEMCVDAHITRSPAQTLSFSIGNMLFRLGVTILLRHTKVDNIDQVSVLRPRTTNEEVVWLDVTIYEVLLVNSLHS